MRKTIRILAIGTAVAIGAIGGYAVAQTAPGPGFGPPFAHGRMSPGTMEPGTMEPGTMGPGMGMRMMGMQGGPGSVGFGDPAARLDAIKAELGIRSEQATAWDGYANAVREAAGQMRAARQSVDMTAVHGMSPQDRQAFASGMRQRHEQSFAAFRTAAEALLPTLDEAQKAKAREVLPGLAAHGPGMMRHAMGLPSGSTAGGALR